MLSNKNIFTHVAAFFVLLGGCLLCRYAFFSYHGMAAWPETLYHIGSGLLAISFVCKWRITPFCIALGYSIGFVAGFLFQTDGVDPGGGTTNNLWIIWTAVFAGLIAIGIIGDIICSARKLRKETL